MKKTLQVILTGLAILVLPIYGFSQAPVLGSAADFALFSSNGAISNNGLSHVTGNVGTNNGSSTAFGNVNGVMNDNNGASVASATDLLTAYNQLDGAIPTLFPAPLLGNGQVLTAGIYSIGGTASLDGTLTLNGQGNANAVFIIQIEGAFSSSAASAVVLSNNAQACNVYWKVEGLISLASGTMMKGTLVANNAAIVLGSGVELEGRALTTTGAITVNGVEVHTPIGCGSPLLTGPAAPVMGTVACYTLFSATGQVVNTGVSNVTGDIGTNSGLTTGFDELNVTGTIHDNPDASTLQAATDLNVLYNSLNVLAHDIELLYPAQLGNDLVLTPHTYLLNAETVLTNDLILDAQDNANAVFVIKINGALTTSTYAKIILINGAQAQNVYWKVTGAVSINDYSEFKGTLVNSGAVILNTGTMLQGRVLTINGSLSTVAVNAVMTPGCGTVVPPCTAPNAPAVTAQSFCTSATIAQLTATGATGAVFNWYTGLTGGTALTSQTALTSSTYYVSQTVNGCESIRVAVAVTINAIPAVPTTATTQAFCAGATVANLSATGVSGATIQWSLTNGGATLSNSTALVAGNYFASQVVGTCESTSVTVAVTINAIPAVPSAATSQAFCAGATVADLSATGVSGATIQWSLTNGGATLSNSTPLVAGNYFASQVVGTCESTSATVAVTINAIPAVPTAATTQSFCAGATVANLSATGVSGSTIQWSLTNGGATLSNSTALVSGNYFASQVVGTCESTSATVAVTINAIPAVPTAATTQAFCAGATVADLSATGVSGATIQWSLTNGGATLSNSTALAAGNYFASQVVGTCESTSVTVAVTINAIPALPTAATTQAFCAGATVSDLSATGVSGATIQWSLTNGGATLSNSTTLVSGNYFVSQVIGTCESTSATVAVTINAIPSVPTGSATQEFTSGETVATLEVSGSDITWYVMVDGELVSILATTELVNGETYYASQTVNGCQSDYFLITAQESLGTASFTIKGIKAYPNPVRDILTISAGETIKSIVIYNLLGQQVLQQSAMENEVKVNVEQLAAGTYLLQATSGTGKNASLKIVKQ